MRAIILAAGGAKRLRPLTDDRPKCLLPVGGEPVLAHQLRALEACGLAPVVAVTGWHEEKFAPFAGRISTVTNREFATTNSLYSFWLCRDHLDAGMVLLNGDVLFSAGLLRALLDHPAPDALLFDPAADLDAEAMKVEVADGLVRGLSKEMPPERAAGENLGVIKLSAAGARDLWAAADRAPREEMRRAWLPRGIDLICGRRPFAAVGCGTHPWIEIDTPGDLARAEREILPRL